MNSRPLKMPIFRTVFCVLLLFCAAGAVHSQNTQVAGTFKTEDHLTPAAANLRVLETVASQSVYGYVDFRLYDLAGKRYLALVDAGVTHLPQNVRGFIKGDGTLMDEAASAFVRLVPTAGSSPAGVVYEAVIYFAESTDGRRQEFSLREYKAIPDQASVDWASIAPAVLTTPAVSYQLQTNASVSGYEEWGLSTGHANPGANLARVWVDSSTFKLSCKTTTGADCNPAGGGGTLTVREVDLAPSVASVTILEFNQAVGLTVADQTGGVARVSLAAIPDSALAQIATASKVSGAALTLLASIPVGAGLIPTANLPSTISYLGSAIDDVELASNYSGIGGCTNQFARTLNDNAAPTCATVTSLDIDTSVASRTGAQTLQNKTLDATNFFSSFYEIAEQATPGNAVAGFLRVYGKTVTKRLCTKDNVGVEVCMNVLADADVPDTITLTNITQITNRAISDTTGTLLEGRGGTGETTYTLGDLLYSDAANSVAKLAGNIITTKQFLSQTGTGAVSAAPAWAQPAFADLSGSATDAQVPDTITITLAATATALAANPTDCAANQFAISIVASGNLTCAALVDADVPDTITASNYLLLAGGTLTGTVMLRAGAAGAGTAPAKFQAGALMTAAEAHAFEWDGANLFVTQATGPTRKTLVYTSLTISTTAPLGGGGDLSADRTLTCTTCTTNAAALTVDQVVVGAAGNAVKILAAGGAATVLTMSGGIPTWVAPGGGAAHAILSATHTDTLAAAVVLGDLIHGNATPAWARLVGNITTTKQFLSQTGTGAVSAAPAWGTIAAADVPSLENLNGTVDVGSGGTGTSTGFTAGSVVFSGAAGIYSQNNSDFFWDNASGELGLGTAGVPDARFHSAQAVDGNAIVGIFENSQANAATSVNETAIVQFAFGGTNDVARLLAGKEEDFQGPAGENDSFLAFWTMLDGVASEAARFSANRALEFNESAGDATCAAGNFNIKGNSTTNKLRGCENGTLFDVNTAGGGAHNMLSTTHTDSTAAAAARGGLIVGKTATPKWELLVVGGAATFLRSDGTDALWASIADADVPNTITIDLAAAATALAANPTDCGANQFAISIVASGNLTCAAIADADVPDTITASNYLLLTGGTLTGTLTLRAGAAGAGTAPAKFQAGALNTTAEAHAFEWDGTNLFVTQATGPTRKEISLLGQSIEDGELASNYSGIGGCTNQFVRTLNDNAAPTCATVTDADVVDTITASNYLLLAGGTLTGTVTLRAGAAGAGTAPAKFQAGAVMTAAEAHAFEWDGTNLFVTQATGPTRKTLVYTSMTISTTAPLGGGGDLSADRTLTCTTCTTNAAALTVDQVVVGAAGNAVKILAAGGAATVLTMSGGIPTWAAPGGGTAHAILSATHTDTTAATVVRGDLMVGQTATPLWQRLVLGAANTFLGSNATDAAWTAPTGGGSVLGTGRTLTGGAGIGVLGDLSADRTISTASGETDFLASGALTCGAATQGRMQVHTTPLEYCDNAATPALQYAAYGTSTGEATAGDTATAFFASGTIEDARLSTNVSLLGSSISLTTEVTGILPGANGGTNNGFMDFTGPATSLKTFTLPNASATILTTNALVTGAQGGTNNGFFEVTGPATSLKTFTFPNASSTVLTTNAAVTAGQGGTGDDTSASTGVPRIAAGNWTYDAGISHLASSTSADLRAALSDETGTGVAVFSGPTAFTLDVEAGTNSITTVSYVTFLAATCQNATATLNFDTPTTSPAVAACITGTNTQKGVADFADAANLSMQTTFPLPRDWTGTVDARFKWLTTAITNSVVWQLSTICVADAETDDPAFNTASTVTDAAKGTANQTNDADIAGVTMTGCAAGELLHLKVQRDSAHASDTLAATARLISLELTLRRGQ